MDKKVLPGLKMVFLVHLVVGLFFGLIYLLAPEWWGDLIGWDVQDPDMWRTVGAAVLAFAASSWFAYNAKLWQQVKIVVLAEIVWTVLCTLTNLWGVVAGNMPTVAWLNVILMAAFAVAFAYFYRQQES